MTESARETISGTFLQRLQAHGVSRRSFLGYCASLTAMLALPPTYAPKIARALAKVEKPSIVWREFQDCAGNTESFLRSRNPGVADLVLDLLSIDYHETIMAAAGAQAEAASDAALTKGGYILVVEGAIPLKDGGVYCTIGGKTALQHVQELGKNAAAIVNVGTCASYGGIPAANPNPTQAVGVPAVISGVPIVNIPACPANAENITATFVHYLTFGALPACDAEGRPLFAYGARIHDACERRAHFDAGQFALAWGDEGHRKGWCLYKLGCKGPNTFNNCSVIRWNDGTNWPVGAGHGCAGCSEPGFWDSMGPLYKRLPDISGFGLAENVDTIGLGIVGATAVAFGAHGVGKMLQHRVSATPGPKSPGEPSAAGEE